MTPSPKASANSLTYPEPNRTPLGYREYDPSVIDRLTFIRAGQAVGLTLAELREVLGIRDRGEALGTHVAGLIDRRIDDIDQRIRDMRRLRRDLSARAGQAVSVDPNDCPPVSACCILTGAR